MKTLLIERVSNGWIARPFQACEHWATSCRSEIAVFQNMEDLQKALPKLLSDAEALCSKPA
jgi:hypothetical protein